MTYDPNDMRQVGFKDAASFAFGIGWPIMFVTMAAFVAVSAATGIGAGPGLSVGGTVGVVAAIAAAMFQRFVISTRPAGGRRAVVAFRGLTWSVIVATPVVTAFVAAGLLTDCYGYGFDRLSWVVMLMALAVCVVSLLTLPLGWRLLHRATWLKPRTG